jgi:hypothetical protein
MEKKQHIIPEVAVKGIASGLIMMACFTLMWAGIAFGGLNGNICWLGLLIFPVFSFVFIINAVKLFRIAKHFPKLTSEADIAREKKTGKWFGIIFGAEGLGIFIGINIVIYLGHPDLVIPVLALVVGLHFYPMAKIFRRTIDYYIATWSTAIAVLAIVFVLNKTMAQSAAMVFVGIGIGIATSSYGFYMVIRGRRASSQMPVAA